MEFLSILKTETKNAKNYILAFFYWLIISLLLGGISGVIGAGFYHCISLATTVRTEYEFLIYFLPLFGVLTVCLYKILKVENQTTNTVFNSVKGKENTSPLLLPAVFIASVFTHIAGGSAGKEGAALQIGGGLSAFLSKIFKLQDNAKKILLIAGMGAVFAAVFGTPITAAVFAITVISVGKIYYSAIIPTFISSITAYFVAKLLGVKAESYTIKFDSLNILLILKLLLLIVASVIVARVFVMAIEYTKKYSARLIKNDYNRILFGGVLIIILSFIFGSDYLGAGLNIIHNAFTGVAINKETFILKIIFTAITVGVGFKGGEIVPAFFVGATFGAALAGELSISVSLGAALGLLVVFCAATKTPLASIFLGIELFGFAGLPYYIIAVILATLLSGKESLYSAQEYLIFNKKKKTV